MWVPISILHHFLASGRSFYIFWKSIFRPISLICRSCSISFKTYICRTTPTAFQKQPSRLTQRWLSQSSNAARDVFNLALMWKTGLRGSLQGSEPTNRHRTLSYMLFVFRRWGSGVRQEVLTSQKYRSEKGWTSPIPWLTAPLSSLPSW